MSSAPVLLVGGSGVVGSHTARCLREVHPGTPLLIAGRSLTKAADIAGELDNAEGVALDLNDDDLGLGDRPVAAVAVFPKDATLAGLRFAQARGVPHVGISGGVNEIGPEVAAYMHRPQAAPVVLGVEWLVGAVTVPSLELAKAFGRLDGIAIGALLDEQDNGGPETTSALRSMAETAPADLQPALTRRDGAFLWRAGDEAVARFRAVDGVEMTAFAISPYDVVGLAAATGAPNVRFDLALGVSSTRRHGEPMSTEILIELDGADHAGTPLRTRHAVVHPRGQIPVTGLGVAMVLERLLGLDGWPPTPAGLYFPYQLLDFASWSARFERIGGRILSLQPT